MLTLKSKFADYFNLIKGIACEDAVAPQSKIASEKTIGEVFAGYRDDPDFNDEWGAWCLNTVGKELDEKIRLMIVNKVTKPETAKFLLVECSHLTENEIGILKKKIEGKLPTVEKEIRDGIVSLKAAVK
jgi:citrate lyase beta subunit